MGYFLAPLDPPPIDKCQWIGRFDDPSRSFRTLYCALHPSTSLRETLGDLRPSVQAMHEFELQFGRPLVRPLPPAWRQSNVLVSARIEIASGDLLLLDDSSLRRTLEREPGIRDLLILLKAPRLDIDKIQGLDRRLTQRIARSLFDRGAAGIVYRSRYDNERCAALFEGRARLVAPGPPKPLIEDSPVLMQVCQDFDLALTS
ncbi:MAG TPA: RES family NAD+ phosphorylase [Thermoanaerobaculia bacterium]